MVKESFAKHQKASKYYENDCLLNVRLLFMCLLVAPIVKETHIYARIYFIFLKKRPKLKFNSFLIPKFDLTEKIKKGVTK